MNLNIFNTKFNYTGDNIVIPTNELKINGVSSIE